MYVKLDAIIFGATGFTGRWVVEHAVDVFKDLTWGVAGRNETGLQNVLKKVGEKLDKDLSKTPIILADLDDKNSIEEMARKCKIVLNCCGPYRFFGETVVKACIEAGTHHVDISGEPQYIDRMQLKYNELANEKKSYVISTCGFDSIPAEMGVLYTERNFPGIVNSIESYWENSLEYKDTSSKALLHFGTWESVVYAMSHMKELLRLKRKLRNSGEKLPTLRPKLCLKPFIQKPSFSGSYFIPMHGGDRDVVVRSQQLLYEYETKRPIQFENYVGFKSLFNALLLPLIVLFGFIFAQCRYGRKILLRFPQIFTLGIVTREGPKEVNAEAHKFSMTFKAIGWSKDQSLSDKPRKELLTRLSGYNPFYGLTALMLAMTAKTILKESDKMPASGGVLSPGAAFAKTNLIENLSQHKNGLKFEILNA